jgi:peptide/nickel transport system ATP-binding protein
VDGVSVDIGYGDVLGVAGESGCGKSTLSNVLMMNIRSPLRFVGGKVVLEGERDLAAMGREEVKAQVWGRMIALVPQSALNALVPTRKVGAFIKDVLRYHLKLNAREAWALAQKRFQELGLPVEALTKYPHQLSGGMRQRVVISVVTLLNPKLLIVDEPTSALDVSTQKQVLKMLLHLQAEQIVRATIFITHDTAILRQIATRIAIMYAGKVVEVGPMERFFQGPIHPYARNLIQAVVTPEPEVKERDLSHIPGEPPDLLHPPEGCRFHPRCPHSLPICSREEPPLIGLGEDRFVACHLAFGPL